MSRAAADALMAIFGLVRALPVDPELDALAEAATARAERREGGRPIPAEAACACGSRHVGTVATARAFAEEHESCRKERR